MTYNVNRWSSRTKRYINILLSTTLIHVWWCLDPTFLYWRIKVFSSLKKWSKEGRRGEHFFTLWIHRSSSLLSWKMYIKDTRYIFLIMLYIYFWYWVVLVWRQRGRPRPPSPIFQLPAHFLTNTFTLSLSHFHFSQTLLHFHTFTLLSSSQKVQISNRFIIFNGFLLRSCHILDVYLCIFLGSILF